MQHLIDYTLHLADNALVLTQRNAAWCGHGPILEQDIAITNITLDLIGQSRNFYQYAADCINKLNATANATEDSLAHLRNERDFKNVLLVEQENGDWAQTIFRQYVFGLYQKLLFEQLQNSSNETLAAIAAKSLKEIKYHVNWSSEWVLRLGDGTEESHNRMQHAVNELWPFIGELFIAADYEKTLIAENIIPNIEQLKPAFDEQLLQILQEATLEVPKNNFAQTGGKKGVHTEKLGYILAEMQYLQRTYPGAEW
jgi:ring-1,2-phenylacetyl-CoA epoxidase subunit PaaC